MKQGKDKMTQEDFNKKARELTKGMEDEEIDEIIYVPTEADKAVINGLCTEVIDILSPLSVPQKAFALQSLISSFEDVANIKLTAIKIENE